MGCARYPSLSGAGGEIRFAISQNTEAGGKVTAPGRFFSKRGFLANLTDVFAHFADANERETWLDAASGATERSGVVNRRHRDRNVVVRFRLRIEMCG
jgi:hypothetical protein